MSPNQVRLASCSLTLRPRVDQLLYLADRAGLALLITDAWRDIAKQMALYQLGRVKNPTTGQWDIADIGLIKTRAVPARSPHCVTTVLGRPAACAVDVVPLDPRGTPVWDPPDMVWKSIYALAAKVGLDAYGDPWGRSLAWDKGHLEIPAWELDLAPLGLISPSPEITVGT